VIQVLDRDYVLICDGETRKMAAPKKKKKKHLAIFPKTLDSLKEKLFNDMRVCDSDVRKALESVGCKNRNKHSGEERTDVQARCD